jgi:hypothetical protein
MGLDLQGVKKMVGRGTLGLKLAACLGGQSHIGFDLGLNGV